MMPPCLRVYSYIESMRNQGTGGRKGGREREREREGGREGGRERGRERERERERGGGEERRE